MVSRLRDLLITKVALVPHGANQEAHIMLFKHDASDPGPVAVSGTVVIAAPITAVETVTGPVQKRDIPTPERNRAAGPSFAGPNRSFPILKPADVAAAARALGRAKGGPAARARIKSRIIAIARRKGAAFVAKLPAAWKVAKTQSDNREESHMAVKIDRTKLTKEEGERLDELEALEVKEDPEPESVAVPEAVQKMLDAQTEEIKKANDRVTKAEADVAKAKEDVRIEKEARERIEFTKVAHDTLPHLPGKDEEKGASLMALAKALTPEQNTAVVALLKAGNEAMAKVLGDEVGSDDRSTSGTAFEKIETLAKELVKNGKATTLPQAIDLVSRTNPDLFAEHMQETRRVIAS